MRSPCPSLPPAVLQTQTAPTGSCAAVSLAGASRAVPRYAVPRYAVPCRAMPCCTSPCPQCRACDTLRGQPCPMPIYHIPHTAPWLCGPPNQLSQAQAVGREPERGTPQSGGPKSTRSCLHTRVCPCIAARLHPRLTRVCTRPADVSVHTCACPRVWLPGQGLPFKAAAICCRAASGGSSRCQIWRERCGPGVRGGGGRRGGGGGGGPGARAPRNDVRAAVGSGRPERHSSALREAEPLPHPARRDPPGAAGRGEALTGWVTLAAAAPCGPAARPRVPGVSGRCPGGGTRPGCPLPK